ncbi:zinc finger CCCH domain-containing protein 3 [Opisthocomus hoazin]|uniref:zinc finger CCCH domain-containing protein 3 n=1 Tax=Opisthocomus hoazin TaxID=30419 RepID=UPI003F5356EC
MGVKLSLRRRKVCGEGQGAMEWLGGHVAFSQGRRTTLIAQKHNGITAPNPLPSLSFPAGFVDVGERWGAGGLELQSKGVRWVISPIFVGSPGSHFGSTRLPVKKPHARRNQIFFSIYSRSIPGSSLHHLHPQAAEGLLKKQQLLAISPLLNQTRPSPQGGKSQHVQQRWRSKGYRCIGGVMYRVSANKLSKTSSTPGRGRDLSTKSPGRAARLHGTPSPGFSPSGCLNRSATSRYIASRAVQRSLAIIRQAKQKKKKKEYCMYYNRFGKCNRGESCPYIHDPEKVAVCTRFLRGTCKKTDGTCSFSHKVSKDKMPVCSYFLKGICSNSNCPYSHVYVSRKAEVCQDFLKGYCPMGEKCKKKHTLVCPDFAKKGVCPSGARCKLLHPQKKRHPREAEDGDRSDRPAKWRRVQEETGRNDPTQLHDDGEMPGPSSAEQEVKFWKETDASATNWLQKLPSFISLQSSASPGDQSCKVEMDEDESEDEPGSTKWKRTLPPASSRDSENARLEEGGRGKQLQIKPRL